MRRIATLLAFLTLALSSMNAWGQACDNTYASQPVSLCAHSTHIFRLNLSDPGATYNWSVTGPASIVAGAGTNEIIVLVTNGGTVGVSCLISCSLGGTSFVPVANYTVMTASNDGADIAGPDTVLAGLPTWFYFDWNSTPPPNHTEAYVGINNGAYSGLLASSMGFHRDSVLMTFPFDKDTGNVTMAFGHYLQCQSRNRKPVVVLGAIKGPATGCLGNTSIYTLPIGAASSWSVTGGTILSGQGTNTISVQWSASGTQSVQCTWSYGAYINQSSTRNISVGSSAPPVLNGPATFCTQGSSYSITAQAGHTYTFSVSGATVLSSSANTVTIQAGASPSFTITATDSIAGCGSSSVTTITNSVPFTTMSGPAGMCSGAPTTYTVAPLPGATYTWSVGWPGTVVSGQGTSSAAVRFNSPAIGVAVRCTVDVGGCSRILTMYPQVYSPPTVNLGPNFSICAPNTVMVSDLNNYGAGPYPSSYLSSYGSTSSTILVQNVGTYWLQRDFVYPNALTCAHRDTLVITATPALTANLGPDFNACTNPYTLSPTVTGATAPFTYTWSTGATTSSINVSTSGSYWVQVNKTGFCSDRDTVNVTMTPMSPVTITAMPIAPCAGQSTTLSATGSFASYQWSTGATTPTITVTPPGSYGLTVTDFNGCVGNASINITPSPNPTPTITGPTVVCGAGPITLSATGFSSYIWSTGATTASISVTTPGTYSVTVTNANGCTGSDSHTVTSGSNPAPAITGPAVICGPGPVTLSTGTFSSYLWSTGATTQSISASTAGTYSVTVTNASGCTGSASRTLTQSNAPATILGANLSTCPGPTTLSSAPFSSYLWSTGATTQSISPSAPGTYGITVTDASGCTWTDTQVLSHHPAPAAILGPDTTMCPDTFTVLASAPFNAYAWSTGATTPSITALGAATYGITVTDANGCTWTDALVLGIDPACVWPGDANHDGVADNADIVAIAFASGNGGAARPGGTTSWYGQPGPPWAMSFPGGANYKHADADASGAITPADTLAVIQNYGLTHNKTTHVTGAIPLHFVPVQSSYTAGDLVQVQVHLGDAANIPSGVVGIAYSVHLNGISTQPGQVWLSFPPSFLGNPASTQLATGFEDVAPGRHDAGQGRMGGFGVGGMGHIATLNIRTDSLNCPLPANTLGLSFSNPRLFRSDFSLEPVSGLPTTISVSGSPTGIAEPQPALSLYPVPAADLLHVAHSGLGEAFSLRVTDLSGRVLLAHTGTQASGQLTLDTRGLAQGAYLLSARTSDGRMITRRFSVVRD